jgi:hypothetical protein
MSVYINGALDPTGIKTGNFVWPSPEQPWTWLTPQYVNQAYGSVQVRNAFFWPFALTATQVNAVTPTSSAAALPTQSLPGNAGPAAATPGNAAAANQDIPGYKGIYDRDFPGNDVQVLSSNDLKACFQACNARTDCKGFVVAKDSQNCWLKGSFGTSVPSTVRPTYLKTQKSIFSFFGSSYVTLYVDCNYSGQAKALAPGAYRWLPDVGFPNDALSAVRVPLGRTITIFENSNFGGRSLTIKRDEPCFLQNQPWFLDGWWNDKASSVIIS